jgi:type IV pilus assembly protein PilW
MMETMVGILIGLLVVLVVYNLMSVAEGFKRTVTGASDAQITGLLSQFIAGRDVANGGNGINIITKPGEIDLTRCANPDLKPIPILIRDRVAGNPSDSFISLQSGSPHVVWPVEFRANAAVNANFVVQSPLGFSSPAGVSLPTAAVPFLIIAIQENGTGCELLRVTNATAPDAVTGNVTLTHSASALAYSGTAIPPARVLNLGPVTQATRVLYDTDQAADTLRTTDLFTAGAPATPIAQNVVMMAVQYGIDTNDDGRVDCWTPVDAATCGNYSEVAVRGFNSAAQFNRMLAIRIGMVVRSDEPDINNATLVSASRPPVVLFNCSANDATCQNRVVVPAGALLTPTGSKCTPNLICDHWRYRTYETIVPLRNALFAASIPP